MDVKLKPYPIWVCQSCGSKASKRGQMAISSWHNDKCGVCGANCPVTEPRDFYYPKFEGCEE